MTSLRQRIRKHLSEIECEEKPYDEGWTEEDYKHYEEMNQ